MEEAVYHILTEQNPRLLSQNRGEVTEGIKGLPGDLQDYLHSIGLAGLMTVAFEKGEQSSPLAVLRAFDRAYQRKTGNAGLFDQTQQYNLRFDGRKRLIK